MADLQAPANAHHQSQHHHLSRQPGRVQQVSDEVMLLSEHAESEDRPQHPRIGKRCRSRRCQDRCLQAITQGSQEGRGALRSPQANPEARSPAIARTEWGSRRVSSGGNSAEPTTNGEVVVPGRPSNSKNWRSESAPNGIANTKPNAPGYRSSPRQRARAVPRRSTVGLFNTIDPLPAFN